MLRLRHQVGDDQRRVGRIVGDDDQLRRPGGHVDADLADEAHLRRGNVGVAGADDLVDAHERGRTERRRRHPRRAAALVDLGDAEAVADVVQLVARRRRGRGDADDLLNAGDARRHRGHHQRRDVDRAAAGHVAADAAQRPHAVPHRAPLIRLRQLRPVERLDALQREIDGLGHLGADGDAARRGPDRLRRDRDAVELRDLLRDVRVAARADAGDDRVGHVQGVLVRGIAPRHELAQRGAAFRGAGFVHSHVSPLSINPVGAHSVRLRAHGRTLCAPTDVACFASSIRAMSSRTSFGLVR